MHLLGLRCWLTVNLKADAIPLLHAAAQDMKVLKACFLEKFGRMR